MTRRVSGPSRKATPSLICLAEASRPDLASPAYSRPSRVPLRSPFTISSRNAFYYLTTRPGIPASTLRLPCVYPASLLRPASPCVLLRSPAFSCVILRLRLASSAVSSSLERSVGSSDRNESIPLPASIFPRVPIIRSPFRDPLDPSILLPVPRVQFRGDFVSGLSKSSSPFLSPFPRVSASDPPSFHRHRCCLPQYPQSFPGVLPLSSP
jgi:hypothetical protein